MGTESNILWDLCFLREMVDAPGQFLFCYKTASRMLIVKLELVDIFESVLWNKYRFLNAGPIDSRINWCSRWDHQKQFRDVISKIWKSCKI